MISIVANGLVPILFKTCLKLGKIIKFVYLFLLCPQKYATIVVCPFQLLSIYVVRIKFTDAK